ncbi:asparagine synthetase B family protein [Methylobacterium sp. J-068]|uniref:asparagine synthetase B family protein n=1 Tax=Methylobacterium sp. J-068 TaxID=2836649 RepID=UPI001FBB1B57|nr:asparagine synthase-related protein [Methylobacterium sp. J-068]MCJ2034850.1 asparagine synthase C-terminal domain-containing protein [Methylobacterium sp. J-068]
MPGFPGSSPPTASAEAIAGLFMLQGDPLGDDDVRAAIRVRSALADGGRTGIVSHDTALLVGGAGSAVPARARGRFAVVLAGRLANADALRAELIALGAPGPMEHDTDVLREAVREWGEAAAARFTGAYAFAIHDAETKTLLCGRDRFGLQPFHYVHLRDRLVFASDLAAIAHWPGVRRHADHDALTHYLAFGFCPADHAPLRGVQRLSPAHTLRAERLRGVRVTRVWTLPAPAPHPAAEAPGPDEARAALRRRLDAAIGDGPVGVLRTGDGPSDALAEAAIRAAHRADGPEVHSFAIHVEGATAPPVAPLRVRSHAVRLDAASASAALGLIPRRGEPLATPGALVEHALLAAASAEVPACLSAAGGAELLLDRPHYAAFGTALARHRDTRIQASPRQGFHATMPFVRDLYGDCVCVSSDPQRLAMSGPALIGSLLLSPIDGLGASLERADAAVATDLCARIDLAHGAPRMLAPLDIARHGAGPALRTPFLDADLAAWCAGLPQAWRLAGPDGTARPGGLVRAALDQPASPRPEVGHALDLWLRTSLRERLEDTVASTAFRNRDLFRVAWIDRLVRDHREGTRSNGALLWALLCLETWFLGFIDRVPELGPSGFQAECAMVEGAMVEGAMSEGATSGITLSGVAA